MTPIPGHRDDRRAGRRRPARRARDLRATPGSVYTCDTYNSLTLDGPVPARTVVDITATFDIEDARARRPRLPARRPALPAHGRDPARGCGAPTPASPAPKPSSALPLLGRLLPSSPSL